MLPSIRLTRESKPTTGVEPSVQIKSVRYALSIVSRTQFSSVSPVTDDLAATVLHFGSDKCKRVLVLRSAGYSVDVCLSLTEFRSALKERAETHAVLVTERP